MIFSKINTKILILIIASLIFYHTAYVSRNERYGSKTWILLDIEKESWSYPTVED